MYKPRQGDIVDITLNPQAGHEQAGRRPALVVWGNDTLDLIPGMAQLCPISNTDNGFPLHIPLDEASKHTTGFVLCEQSKVLDLDRRNAAFRDHASEEVLRQVLGILHLMLP